ncbi:MAG: hypothetical protein GY869_11055 [Planctomycetes bacterium]|nr:hypothetical protein [Planctomycetota bacterium]
MKRKVMWSLLLLFWLGAVGCESYILEEYDQAGAGEPVMKEPATAMDEEMSALAAEWMALEKLEGRQVLALVDEQIKQIESMRIDYTVATDYGPASLFPNTRSTFKVGYIRKGQRYHLHELNRLGDQDVLEARTIYDGEQLVQYEYAPDDQNPHQAHIFTGEEKTKLGSVNDYLDLAGLDLENRTGEDWVVNNLGFEKLGIIDVLKLQIIKSISGGNIYIYLWIKPQTDSYQLLQVQGLIDDNPEKLLFEVKNTYRTALNVYLPWLILSDRYMMNAEGDLELDFRARVMVEEMEIDGAIEETELVFALPEGTVIRQED